MKCEKVNEKGYYGIFSSIRGAKERCVNDEQCGGIYDNNCDESENDIHLCYAGYNYEDDRYGDCIYEKTGNLSYVDLFLFCSLGRIIFIYTDLSLLVCYIIRFRG